MVAQRERTKNPFYNLVMEFAIRYSASIKKLWCENVYKNIKLTMTEAYLEEDFIKK